MTAAEIHQGLVEIVVNSLRVEPSTVTLDSYLDELGAQSLDLVEISMEAESKFHVWLPDKSLLETAQEVFGREAITHADQLTDFGKQIFRARLPSQEWPLLDGDVSTAALQHYFLKVSTWVRMIENLREYTPVACSGCGSGKLSEAPGLALSCQQCGEEMPLRSGQDINREWLEQFPKQSGLGALKALSSAAG